MHRVPRHIAVSGCLAQNAVHFQLDEQRPGSGLGLDIVRTLAHTYGGRIEVLDAPLGGARLRLWLPQALAE